jgi:DNA-binding beta-propeller fold protein YncE
VQAAAGNGENVLARLGALTSPITVAYTPSGDVYVTSGARIKLISYATPSKTPSPSAGFTPSRTPTQTATVTRGITRVTASVERPYVFAFAGTQRSFGNAGDGRSVASSGVRLYPWGLAIDSARKVMYVSNYGPSSISIRAINMTTGVISTYAGTGASGSKDGPRLKSTWGFPRGMAVDPATGDLAVADQTRSTVRVVYANGTVLRRAGIDGINGWNGDGGLGTKTMLGWPTDVAYRRSSGSFLFTDYLRHIVRELFPNGTVRAWAGKYGGALFSRSTPQHRLQGRFLFPMAIAVADASQTVYVSGRGGEWLTGNQYWMIWRVSGDVVSQLVGKGQQGILTVPYLTPDGLPASSTGISFVYGMAVDPAGRLVYADRK